MSVTISAKLFPVLELHHAWEVKTTGDSEDPLFVFSARPWPIIEVNDRRYAPPIPKRTFDAFKLRDEFFAIREPHEAHAFFMAYGPWQRIAPDRVEAPNVRFSALMAIRKSYERALLRKKFFKKRKAPKSMADFLKEQARWGPLVTELLLQEPPAGIVNCPAIEEAVRATVILNKFENLPFRRCAREGCRKLFKVEHKYPKKYCEWKCGHLQAVIKYDNSPQGKATAEKRRTRKKAEAAAVRVGRGKG